MYDNLSDEALKQQIRDKRMLFEEQGGRGIELADEIDALEAELEDRQNPPKLMKVYGWEEGISEMNYLPRMQETKSEGVEVDEDGMLVVGGPSDGEWYDSFTAAKKAIITQLQYNLKWNRQAIKDLRALRKNEVGR